MNQQRPRALSIRQPWAWLIVNGYKNIENRDWPTKYRGRFLIHAGKSIDMDAYRAIRRIAPEITLPRPEHLDRGGIVGEAIITGCVERHTSRWFFGKWGFIIEGAKVLPFRPYRGQLGFFDVELR